MRKLAALLVPLLFSGGCSHIHPFGAPPNWYYQLPPAVQYAIDPNHAVNRPAQQGPRVPLNPDPPPPNYLPELPDDGSGKASSVIRSRY